VPDRDTWNRYAIRSLKSSASRSPRAAITFMAKRWRREAHMMRTEPPLLIAANSRPSRPGK
jgi:hypothetical protein